MLSMQEISAVLGRMVAREEEDRSSELKWEVWKQTEGGSGLAPYVGLSWNRSKENSEAQRGVASQGPKWGLAQGLLSSVVKTDLLLPLSAYHCPAIQSLSMPVLSSWRYSLISNTYMVTMIICFWGCVKVSLFLKFFFKGISAEHKILIWPFTASAL